MTARKASAQVNWMSWEEMNRAYQENPKKVMVNVYTNWCRWCKKMEMQTFQDPDLSNYLNEHFYCVRFNAESTEMVNFQGEVYRFQKADGYHELAAKILNGRMSYPTFVFLDENLQVIQPIPGFKDPRDFQMITSYFATGHYMKTPWAIYKSKYSDSGK
jgi:thioredoxin-related protein